ncbi:hypothetical protein G3I13_07450 [Streptomyces sp. SID6673]|nr:hypothetical protein [Streptomyces sp. SID11726]NEB24162.1 hypothetical protein [Streptomyces sp. SID6673]
MSTPQGATIASTEQPAEHATAPGPDATPTDVFGQAGPQGDRPAPTTVVTDKLRNAVIAGGIGIAVVFALIGFGAGYFAGNSSSSDQGPGMNMPGGTMPGGGMGSGGQGGMGQMPGGQGQMPGGQSGQGGMGQMPGGQGGMGQMPGGQGGMGQMPGGQTGQGQMPGQTGQTAPTQGSTTS